MTFAWSPGGDFGSPTYSKPIPVVDGVRSTFIGERRKRWSQAFQRALDLWMLPFTLTYRPESLQPFVVTEATISSQGNGPLCIAGKIAVVRLHSTNAIDSAGWIDAQSGGFCLFTPWRAWWMYQIGEREITGVAAHEIGHALGFGHGGNGVMSGGDKPNTQERQLAAAYYGV